MSASSPLRFDLPARLLHWGLAALLTLNLFVLEEGEQPHTWVGYSASAFVALRFAWGFFGGEPSRFRGFLGRHGWLPSSVYAALWLLVLSLGATGFLMGTDAYFGEEWLEELHLWLSRGVQALVAIHLAGLGIHSARRKKHAWRAMFYGERVP